MDSAVVRQPVVGVTGSVRGGRMMWWFYWLSLRLNGIRPLRLTAPCEPEVIARLDGLVVGGGDHISAELYQGMAVPDVRIDPDRDRLELAALDDALARDIPVLGICRGAQMLNVALGGSLHHNIYDVFEGAPRLWTPLPRKEVSIDPGSRLRHIVGRETLVVNSLHTQSVDRLGTNLRVCGRDSHGIIQAIEDPSARFRIGVQWHPEFLIYQRAHRQIFSAFVDALRNAVPG